MSKAQKGPYPDEMDESLDFRRGIDPNSLYELTSLLGEGSYGAVYRAIPRNVENGEEVAIKIIPDADDDLTALWREIRFLQVLRSPFVVSFIESLLYDNELWLVMELCDGGSLYDLKEANKGCFTEAELQGIMAFCALGLAHLHAQMSIHRDVKSGNILLTKDGRAKLGDFGISAQLTDTIMKRRTVIGSPYWMAPEVIQETSYDGKADIWSLGITLLELCEGSPPHFNVHPMRAIFIISSRAAPTLKEPNKWSAEMQDFVSKCLMKDCEKRATAAELLKHPWIRSCVKEIGSGGRGLPILQDLILENWDATERVRAARFKLPENIPVGEGAANLLPVETAYETNNNVHSDATIRRNSFSSGIPATRQQMRNASLSRSQTPNPMRGRSGSNPAHYYEGDEGDINTLVMRPTSTPRGNMTFNRLDFKDVPQNKLEFTDAKDNDYDSGTMVGSMIRGGTTGRVPADNAYGAKDMQAALKYFRDEATAGNMADPKTVSRNGTREFQEKGNAQHEEATTREVPISPSLVRLSMNVTNKDTYAAEVALLEELTAGDSEQQDQSEVLKKEIMKQLSVLKKQYRDDLETLTKSYEARRKVLKEALMTLSPINPNLNATSTDAMDTAASNIRKK